MDKQKYLKYKKKYLKLQKLNKLDGGMRGYFTSSPPWEHILKAGIEILESFDLDDIKTEGILRRGGNEVITQQIFANVQASYSWEHEIKFKYLRHVHNRAVSIKKISTLLATNKIISLDPELAYPMVSGAGKRLSTETQELCKIFLQKFLILIKQIMENSRDNKMDPVAISTLFWTWFEYGDRSTLMAQSKYWAKGGEGSEKILLLLNSLISDTGVISMTKMSDEDRARYMPASAEAGAEAGAEASL